jgi:hypothetical protein
MRVKCRALSVAVQDAANFRIAHSNEQKKQVKTIRKIVFWTSTIV